MFKNLHDLKLDYQVILLRIAKLDMLNLNHYQLNVCCYWVFNNRYTYDYA